MVEYTAQQLEALDSVVLFEGEGLKAGVLGLVKNERYFTITLKEIRWSIKRGEPPVRAISWKDTVSFSICTWKELFGRPVTLFMKTKVRNNKEYLLAMPDEKTAKRWEGAMTAGRDAYNLFKKVPFPDDIREWPIPLFYGLAGSPSLYSLKTTMKDREIASAHTPDGRSLVYLACQYCVPSTVQCLALNFAPHVDPNEYGPDGKAPIHLCVEDKHNWCLTRLLGWSDVVYDRLDANGNDLVALVMEEGDTDVIQTVKKQLIHAYNERFPLRQVEMNVNGRLVTVEQPDPEPVEDRPEVGLCGKCARQFRGCCVRCSRYIPVRGYGWAWACNSCEGNSDTCGRCDGSIDDMDTAVRAKVCRRCKRKSDQCSRCTHD
ncbi:hypothetical protein KIPB_000921 [Kipferlia bialata]|uniref:PH domain-containing protein n=1 Tax=Kipferlia bialata TaxID=797122 RepID=A0A391NRT7_9EUKA|nr:hypothetical protein KIPB_000921 [Kipferlia bialata]|eukprot:g921.t1